MDSVLQNKIRQTWGMSATYQHLVPILEQVSRLSTLVQDHPELAQEPKFREYHALAMDTFPVVNSFLDMHLNYSEDAIHVQLKRDAASLRSDVWDIANLVAKSVSPGTSDASLEDGHEAVFKYRIQLRQCKQQFGSVQALGAAVRNSNSVTHNHNGTAEENQSTRNGYRPPSLDESLSRQEAQTEFPGRTGYSVHEQHQSSYGERVEFFPDVEGLEINDGNYSAISGSFYSPDYQGPYHQQETPNRGGGASFFPRLKNGVLNGGEFMSIGGSYYGPRPPSSPSPQFSSTNGMRQAPRTYQQSPRSPIHQPRDYPTQYQLGAPSGHTWPSDSSYRRSNEVGDQRTHVPHHAEPVSDDRVPSTEHYHAANGHSQPNNSAPNISPPNILIVEPGQHSHSRNGENEMPLKPSPQLSHRRTESKVSSDEEHTLRARFGHMQLGVMYQHSSSSRTSLNEVTNMGSSSPTNGPTLAQPILKTSSVTPDSSDNGKGKKRSMFSLPRLINFKRKRSEN